MSSMNSIERERKKRQLKGRIIESGTPVLSGEAYRCGAKRLAATGDK